MKKLVHLSVPGFVALMIFSCGLSPKNSVSVVTFNMYVGFDVESRFAEFASGGDLVETASAIFTDFQASMPIERIERAASEMALLSPDFIGLQEVTLFVAAPVFSSDYLSLLIEAIKDAGGPDYNHISTENMAIEESVNTGVFPVAVFFSDSEAILYKKNFKIAGDIVEKKLAAHREAFSYNDKEVIFYRSLLGARFSYGDEIIASVFTTHLDQEYLGDVQKNQMSEIISILKDYSEDENLVLVGDFNSEEGDETYGLAPADGFTDTYRAANPDDTGLTCCNLSDLSNEEAIPYQKIDLIFHKSSHWQISSSEIILNKKNPVWPSDHFGVLTEFTKVPGYF